MSGNDESSSADERHFEDGDDDDDEYSYDVESSEEEEALSAEDERLFGAVAMNDVAAVQQALRDGANVNAILSDLTPLLEACRSGYDQIIRILLRAGADARWRNRYGTSAISLACNFGRLSTVQMLIKHDIGLLEIATDFGWTPLFDAVCEQDSGIVRFLLDSGADPRHVDESGQTTLMIACQTGQNVNGDLEIVQLLLAAAVDVVEARDHRQRTALHHTAVSGRIDIMRYLILQHNCNMLAVDVRGFTPFDTPPRWEQTTDVVDHQLEMYARKLAQDHGRLALHELLKVAEYSFAEELVKVAESFFEDDEGFHPPLNPLTIIMPLGKLKLKHLRTLLHTLDPELIRNRDGNGKLPIHVACQTNAPLEVLALILELDPGVLHIADSTGALPIHLLCGTTRATEYASVRYLVEQGGVGTLAASDRQSLLPLHVLCRSKSPSLRAVQFLIQSFPGSLAVRTNAGQYPFMMAAAANSSSASLSVIYELVRANPDLFIPR